MAKAKKTKEENDPLIDGLEELTVRVATLEANQKWIIEKLKDLDQKVWYILSGVIISVLLAILHFL